MKFGLFALFVFLNSISGRCQRSITDSLRIVLSKQKSDTDRVKTLCQLSYYFDNNKPDSALLFAQSAYTLAKHIRFERGESKALGELGGAFNRLGNYSTALKNYLVQLQLLENQHNPKELAIVYISIAMVYNSQKDAGNAIKYAYRADSIVKADDFSELSLYTSLDIGDIYTNNGQLDSAEAYTERCYRKSLQQQNDLLIGTALNNLGNIYFKSGSYAKARRCYEQSIPYLNGQVDYNTLAECFSGLAKTFDQLGGTDSALFYANKAYQLASRNQFLKHAVDASSFLTQLYKKRGRIDSAFAYQQTYVQLKDSFDNSEKIKTVQMLTTTEQLREKQLAEEKAEEERDRSEKLQMLLVGIFIPILFFLSIYISRKRVHRKAVQILGVLSLLFFFEYITLLLHPIVAKSAGHSPVFEILIFVAIAAVVLPAHHRIEHWLMHKLTHSHEQHLAKLKAAMETEGKEQ